MKTKNYYFASANTGDGFINYLDQINPDGLTYIIKGGSGTGKSTMMKKISAHFFEIGYSVENFYCSTDTTSLDAVRIPEKKLAIIDGTAPHVVEPFLAGVTHKIIDAGQFIDPNVEIYRDELKKLARVKKQCFENMYGYLNSAKILDDINLNIENQFVNRGVINKKAKSLFAKVLKLEPIGLNRKLFLQSVNKENFDLENQNNFKKITFSLGREEGFCVLEKLYEMLEKQKLPCQVVCDVLNPKRIKAIIINNKFIIKNIETKFKLNKSIEKNNKIIKKLINLSKNELAVAKSVHAQIEKIYISNVNFDGVQKLTEEIIREIEAR